MPLLLPPFARRQFRDAALDLARECQRGAAHLAELPVPLDPHQNVHAAATGGLRPAGEPEIRQHGVDHLCHPSDLRPPDPWHGVEIDAELVRVVQFLGANGMRVELEAGQVG